MVNKLYGKPVSQLSDGGHNSDYVINVIYDR